MSFTVLFFLCLTLMYFSLPVSVLAPSLTHLPFLPHLSRPLVSLSDLQFFPLFLISGIFLYFFFSYFISYFLPQSLILYVFMLYPNPLPFFSCSPCGQYLRLKGHFSFSLWSFPVPSPSAYLPKGGIIKVSCLFWLSYLVNFRFPPVFHLGMKGVGGSSPLNDSSLGLAKRGRFFGAYYFLSLPLRSFGKLHFKLVSPRDLRQSVCLSNPTLPIIITLPKSRAFSFWLSPKSSQKITSGFFGGIGCFYYTPLPNLCFYLLWV